MRNRGHHRGLCGCLRHDDRKAGSGEPIMVVAGRKRSAGAEESDGSATPKPSIKQLLHCDIGNVRDGHPRHVLNGPVPMMGRVERYCAQVSAPALQLPYSLLKGRRRRRAGRLEERLGAVWNTRVRPDHDREVLLITGGGRRRNNLGEKVDGRGRPRSAEHSNDANSF
jgi:hypothetical protein